MSLGLLGFGLGTLIPSYAPWCNATQERSSPPTLLWQPAKSAARMRRVGRITGPSCECDMVLGRSSKFSLAFLMRIEAVSSRKPVEHFRLPLEAPCPRAQEREGRGMWGILCPMPRSSERRVGTEGRTELLLEGMVSDRWKALVIDFCSFFGLCLQEAPSLVPWKTRFLMLLLVGLFSPKHGLATPSPPQKKTNEKTLKQQRGGGLWGEKRRKNVFQIPFFLKAVYVPKTIFVVSFGFP